LSSIDDREHPASNGEEHSYEMVAIRKEKEARTQQDAHEAERT